MNKQNRSRTQIKDLPRQEKELTLEEQKNVRGGLLAQDESPEQAHAPYQPSTTTTRPNEPAGTGNGGLTPLEPTNSQTPKSTR